MFLHCEHGAGALLSLSRESDMAIRVTFISGRTLGDRHLLRRTLLGVSQARGFVSRAEGSAQLSQGEDHSIILRRALISRALRIRYSPGSSPSIVSVANETLLRRVTLVPTAFIIRWIWRFFPSTSVN